MIKLSIIEAQDYLRVKTEDGYKRIVDIHSLLKSHSINEVVLFLKDYLREKENSLRNMILIDKTHCKVDQIVASMFRITMAIKALKEGEEVISLEESQQRAETRRTIHKRNSRGHRSSWKRENKNHDGKNRVSGNPAKRAA
jgi:FtsZ-binding cell division protein ZapB